MQTRFRVALVTAFLCLGLLAAPHAQDGFMATPAVAGSTVSITWTAFPGAAGYRLGAGTFQGGSDLASLIILGQSAGPAALPVGEYFARVEALDAVGTVLGRTSEISFLVGTPRPGAPQSFTAALSAPTLAFSWAEPGTGGAPSAYAMDVGTEFGVSNVAGALPMGAGLSNAFDIGGVLPNGNYFARLYAGNAGGVSDASDETVFTVGTTIPGVPVPLPAVVAGSTATISWLPPAGGAPPTSYVLEVALNDPRQIRPLLQFPAGQTSFSAEVPAAHYYWRIRAIANGVAGGVYATSVFAVGQSGVSERRLPNPKTGRRLPYPSYGAAIVRQVAAAYPAQLRNSCVEHGGNNAWLYLLVRELRKYDTRWGLNWKRGNVGDMSQDIVAYNYGSLPDENSTEVYIIDTVTGHCGSNPVANFADVTAATARGGSIGRFTLQPYLAAGLPLIP